MSNTSGTQLLYLEDFTVLQNEARVVDIVVEDGKSIILLDQTIFYPQGGGQPYDKGAIQGDSGKFAVEEVRFVDGIVRHIGAFESGSFSKGEAVMCNVNVERRALHSRLHSGGHVVDLAVTSLSLPWTPGKGYHFPDGPYVEYTGNLNDGDKEKLKTDLEAACNRFIQEDRKTVLQFMDKEKMHEVCHFVPDYIPENKPARVVMYGDFGVPCGGTHVSHLLEIRSMTIRKLKQKGDKIQVAYDVLR